MRQNNHGIKYKKINSIIGYLPQNFGLFKELTVSEALQYFSNLKGIEASAAQKDIDNILNKVNLYNQKNEKIKSLSGGMIRRLGIAQALLGDPKILIFDEPTAGLDPEERLRFKNIISQIGNEKIVIISTHIVEDVESICNKIVIMKDGTIVKSGSCNEISESAKGMVYVLPQNELEIINTTYSIQKYFERDGNKLVRILSKIELPYNVVEPNVEDGYLCVLNII